MRPGLGRKEEQHVDDVAAATVSRDSQRDGGSEKCASQPQILSLKSQNSGDNNSRHRAIVEASGSTATGQATNATSGAPQK